MDSSTIGLTKEMKAILNEGIGLIFSLWTALQAALEFGLANRSSEAIYESLASNVFDYLIQSKDPVDSYGLEDILHDGFDELCTNVEDGSIEEVTNKLLNLYEECCEGTFKSIEYLRVTKSQMSASVFKVPYDNDDESDDEVEEDTCMNNDQTTDMMMVDEAEAMPVDEPVADDGWTLASSRKNKSKENKGMRN